MCSSQNLSRMRRSLTEMMTVFQKGATLEWGMSIWKISPFLKNWYGWKFNFALSNKAEIKPSKWILNGEFLFKSISSVLNSTITFKINYLVNSWRLWKWFHKVSTLIRSLICTFLKNWFQRFFSGTNRFLMGSLYQNEYKAKLVQIDDASICNRYDQDCGLMRTR